MSWKKIGNIMGPKGPQGRKGESVQGERGYPGAPGRSGIGVPAGGTTGQVLVKTSATNFETEWVDASVSAFDPDTILTGLNVSNELAVLVDNNGNVLIGV